MELQKKTISTWIKDKEKIIAAGKVNPSEIKSPKPKTKILTKQCLHGSKTALA